MNVMLDHSANEVNKKGNEVYVAQQEVEVTPDKSANFLEYGLWGAGIALVIYIFATKPSDAGLIATIFKALCALIPAGWFFWQKKQTESYFAAHQQKIQAAASEIDNYTANRAKILIDIYELTHGAIRLDKDVMTAVAAYRGGVNITPENRNQIAKTVDNAFRALLPQIEAYPDLKAHSAIEEAMRQNVYWTKEVTATRTQYNDLVSQWNRDIFQWPIKRMMAASMHLHTMIPFALSEDQRNTYNSVSFKNSAS